MRRQPLEEGDLWFIDSFDTPVGGYGVTWVCILNETKISVGKLEAAEFHVHESKLYQLAKGDRIMVFTSKISEDSRCNAFFIRTRDFFRFDAEVHNCSSWRDSE